MPTQKENHARIVIAALSALGGGLISDPLYELLCAFLCNG